MPARCRKRGPNCGSPWASARRSRASDGTTNPTASGSAQAATASAGAPAGQADAGDRMARRADRGEARAAARQPLDDEDDHDEGQQGHRQLRRGGAVAEREPGAVDPGGEGLHAEVRDRAVVGQRLHQGQRRAADDRRPGHRQRDAQEAAPRRQAERAAGVEQGRAALEEGDARQQVDIRIEHARQHDDRAAEAAHVGEPVVAGGSSRSPRAARSAPDRRTAAGRRRHRP